VRGPPVHPTPYSGYKATHVELEGSCRLLCQSRPLALWRTEKKVKLVFDGNDPPRGQTDPLPQLSTTTTPCLPSASHVIKVLRMLNSISIVLVESPCAGPPAQDSPAFCFPPRSSRTTHLPPSFAGVQTPQMRNPLLSPSKFNRHAVIGPVARPAPPEILKILHKNAQSAQSVNQSSCRHAVIHSGPADPRPLRNFGNPAQKGTILHNLHNSPPRRQTNPPPKPVVMSSCRPTHQKSTDEKLYNRC
jgi:hypothetical protein